MVIKGFGGFAGMLPVVWSGMFLDYTIYDYLKAQEYLGFTHCSVKS